MKAVLLISHGSRSAQTTEEVKALVDKLQAKSTVDIVEFAFLELASPNIPAGIDQCVQKGAKEVKILLNFLNSGRHVDNDIPEIVSTAQKKYPDIKISISQPVGQHDRIVDLFLDLMN